MRSGDGGADKAATEEVDDGMVGVGWLVVDR
jgi:hypothetical protein